MPAWIGRLARGGGAAGGSILVALRGGAFRFDSKGRIEREIRVACKYPTMMAFGGPDLRTVFVTSGRWAIADKDAADHPLDGSIFAFEAPVPGLPTSRWAG